MLTLEYLYFIFAIDHEMKQLHKDALDALTSIEIEFASLRDKYVSGTSMGCCCLQRSGPFITMTYSSPTLVLPTT